MINLASYKLAYQKPNLPYKHSPNLPYKELLTYQLTILSDELPGQF